MNKEKGTRRPATTVPGVACDDPSPVEQAELVASQRQGEGIRRAFAAPRRRRLGAMEYTLLTLIALGVAITIGMAIVNP